MLGSAWESVDINYALQLALAERGDMSVAYLAHQRIEDLRRSKSKRSLHPGFADKYPGSFSPGNYLPNEQTDTIRHFYSEARREAADCHEQRTAYMISRLVAGQHPDTHAAFWDAWVEPSQPPRLPGSSISNRAWVGIWTSGMLGAV